MASGAVADIALPEVGNPPAKPIMGGWTLLRRLFAWVSRPGARKGLVVVFDQGFCSITNFLTGMLVVRACSKAQYGLYVLGFTIIMTFQIILRSLVSVPFTINSPRLHGKDRAEYFGSTLVQELIMSAVAAVGVAAVAVALWATGRGDGLLTVLAALSVVLFGMALRDFMRLALLAQLNVWASLAMGLAANVTTLGLLFWAYASGLLSTPVAYFILAFCSGSAASAILFYERRRLSIVPSRLVRDVRKNWNCGKWTLAAVVSNTLGIRSMPWLVLLWCGNESVAMFGALAALAGIVNPLITGLAVYLMPKLANDHKTNEPAKTVGRAVMLAKVLAVVSVAYVAAAAIWGNKVAGLIYTAHYQGFGLVLTVLAVVVAIEAVTVPLKALLRVTKRPKIEFHGTVSALIVSLLLSAYLIPEFGILGASIALAAGRLMTFFIALAAVQYGRRSNYTLSEAARIER